MSLPPISPNNDVQRLAYDNVQIDSLLYGDTEDIQTEGVLATVAQESHNQEPEIALAAVVQYGRVLEFASEELRNDRDVVLAAVVQNGLALQYPTLRGRTWSIFKELHGRSNE